MRPRDFEASISAQLRRAASDPEPLSAYASRGAAVAYKYIPLDETYRQWSGEDLDAEPEAAE